ncbi:hypothetical protein BT96DRAFT_153501 [Gymnopus androsaceus JB14]|uniref:Uncharacterized protein n=1 Tax=Gymnopus androsaceus JB14 TaxID=1447944 RepID=A0A6A4HDQ4_9AGAR|nr:hypothetical protein BT96DRAFT_153501 [Gymnopus androsaceus JB14]
MEQRSVNLPQIRANRRCGDSSRGTVRVSAVALTGTMGGRRRVAKEASGSFNDPCQVNSRVSTDLQTSSLKWDCAAIERWTIRPVFRLQTTTLRMSKDFANTETKDTHQARHVYLRAIPSVKTILKRLLVAVNVVARNKSSSEQSLLDARKTSEFELPASFHRLLSCTKTK